MKEKNLHILLLNLRVLQEKIELTKEGLFKYTKVYENWNFTDYLEETNQTIKSRTLSNTLLNRLNIHFKKLKRDVRLQEWAFITTAIRWQCTYTISWVLSQHSRVRAIGFLALHGCCVSTKTWETFAGGHSLTRAVSVPRRSYGSSAGSTYW